MHEQRESVREGERAEEKKVAENESKIESLLPRMKSESVAMARKILTVSSYRISR